ncbi:MAG: class I SAM-dependent methyltransferase [Saprospiraceae bacterium]|nr:MAG: class I SAM-dependent methyltransferase [Saprospiraceae bacterium]
MSQMYFDQNEKMWDARVSHHVKSEFYNMEGFRQGKSSLTEIEAHALGDVKGRSLLHLQCHFGQDTLSWARQGAIATGIDISGKAIEVARGINEELGLNARFIKTNLYDLPQVLDEKFDFVFTSYGATCWLPDLKKWAAIVNRFLKKGGIFYMAEFHPALYMFNFDSGLMEYSYFNVKVYEEEEEGTYTDRKADLHEKSYFWIHSLAETIMALRGEGLLLVEFKEYDFSPYNCFPKMAEREPGRFEWGGKGLRIPHVYSLKMEK